MTNKQTAETVLAILVEAMACAACEKIAGDERSEIKFCHPHQGAADRLLPDPIDLPVGWDNVQ